MSNDDFLKIVAYVDISPYRRRILKTVGDEIKFPTTISSDSKLKLNHVSRVLGELKQKGLVECINEEMRKGRLYRLTPLGKRVLARIR